MFKVILPQIMRQVLPAMTNEIILIFKDTALLAAVAMGDLLRAAKELMSQQFKVTPLLVALVIYLTIVAIIVYGLGRLEKRFSVYL
jgi:polar amino acid transport system permease protein